MLKYLRIAWQRIRRAPYQTAAALSVMTLTLFLGSVFFLLAAGSDMVLRYFESRPQINAYFKTDYLPDQTAVDQLTRKLESTQKTAAVRFISKEDALKIYQEANKSDPLLLEAVTAGMLPASFEVSAKDPRDLKVLAEILKQEPNIEEVSYAEDIISTLTVWINSIRIIGASLILAHVFITFIVIILIIGMKVSVRREEIHTIRLLGAGGSYISVPFIFEGMLYGIGGAVISWVVIYTLLLYSTPFLVRFLSGIPVLPVPILFMAALLGGELLLGVLVGGLGGWLACRRFLKA